MDEKAQALKVWLEKAFPGSVIEYQFPLTVHKFRINNENTAYWLYVSRKFVDDNEVGHGGGVGRAGVAGAYHQGKLGDNARGQGRGGEDAAGEGHP